MMAPRTFRRSQTGDSLIEILVTLVILMVGLLGLMGLMVQSQRSQMESYQRVQALMMLDDMVNRINANRKAADSYVIAGTLGTGAASPNCPNPVVTATPQERAACDLKAWHDLLLGSNETMNGTNVGGMLGARGCVELVSPGVYMVSVAWQGNSKTFAPSGITCATGLYGDETQRRGVSVHLQIASLS